MNRPPLTFKTVLSLVLYVVGAVVTALASIAYKEDLVWSFPQKVVIGLNVALGALKWIIKAMPKA